MLLFDKTDGIVTLTLDRPPVNVLNRALRRELRKAFEQIDRDVEARAVIVTGHGEKAFAAGADIRELQTLSGPDAEAMVCEWHGLFRRMETLRLPVIAAINGVALGGGCELAMACDMRVVSENARIGQPEINLGIIPGWGGTQRLARLVGAGRALEMLMTGDPIDSAEALRIGWANRVTSAEELIPVARSLAAKMTAKSAVALRLVKECVYTGLDGPLSAGIACETEKFGQVCETADKTEGIAAFLEKRSPRFRGR